MEFVKELQRGGPLIRRGTIVPPEIHLFEDRSFTFVHQDADGVRKFIRQGGGRRQRIEQVQQRIPVGTLSNAKLRQIAESR